jgi:hypothetical protein
MKTSTKKKLTSTEKQRGTEVATALKDLSQSVKQHFASTSLATWHVSSIKVKPGKTKKGPVAHTELVRTLKEISEDPGAHFASGSSKLLAITMQPTQTAMHGCHYEWVGDHWELVCD